MKKGLFIAMLIGLNLILWQCKSGKNVVDLNHNNAVGGIDLESGLVNDPNLMLVKSQCTACHSAKLITMNRFSREGWQEKIRWMQKTQKLWDLGESEPVILDYLEKHYAPIEQLSRRENLKNIEWYQLK